MAPPQFYVRLQKGITGGFAPPTPDEVHVVSHSPSAPNDLFIQSNFRKEGTPNLSDSQPKKVTVDRSNISGDPKLLKVAKLYNILKDLPTELPPGSQDIYGLDTSIMWGSDDLEWCNGGPQGCSGGESSVQATDEQKEQFKKAVQLVKEITA